jgi:hypothetical protein
MKIKYVCDKWITSNLFFILILCVLLIGSCKKEPDLDRDQILEIELVTSLNNDVWEKFEEAVLIQEQDTAEALEVLYDYIILKPEVEWAEINGQGIAIQYKSGIRGGIMVNGQDDHEYGIALPEPPFKSTLRAFSQNDFLSVNNDKSVSADYPNIPENKKTIFINPHYFERTVYADKIIEVENYWFQQCGYEPPVVFKNNTAKVDVFTTLQDYGIVHVYSHGWAWPNEVYVEEVYCMTGERENNTTTAKYWDDIKKGEIPLVINSKNSTKYFLSPKFISKYNNFEDSKTFYYGGYCYSFLGNWPNEIVDNAGAIAYTGFSWFVRTSYNASWSQWLFYRMMDKSAPVPMSLEEWLTTTNNNVDKKYWETQHDANRWVSFHYNGASDAVFWQPMKITPNDMTGEIDKEYSWKVEVPSFPAQYQIEWDFGDGKAKTKVDNSAEIMYAYTSSGSFNITAKLYSKPTNQLIGSASGKAVIKSTSTSSGEDFGFSWDILYDDLPEYAFTLSSSISGSVKGLNGNSVTKIEGFEFGIGRVNIEMSQSGPFQIGFNCSFSISPTTWRFDNIDGSYSVLSYDNSKKKITWRTQTFEPYTYGESGSGSFQNDNCRGDISVFYNIWSTWEEFDKDGKLLETREDWAGAPLFFVSIWPPN